MRDGSGDNMNRSPTKRKATDQADANETLPEYDFSLGSPNKYASRYAADRVVVVLEPDVAAVFSSSGRLRRRCVHWP